MKSMVRSRSTSKRGWRLEAGLQGGFHASGPRCPGFNGPGRPAAPAGRAAGRRRGPASDDAAGLHDVAAVGDGQRGARVLVDQQDRRAARLQRRDVARRSRPPAAAPGPCSARRAAAAAGRPSARGRWPASAAGRPTACRRSPGAFRAAPGTWPHTRVDRVAGVPRAKAPSRRLSSHLMAPNTWRPSGTCTMPRCTRWRGRSGADVGAVEAERASRWHGCTPDSERSSVVLPAPLAPTSATSSPVSHAQRDLGQRRDAAVAAGQAGDLKHGPPPRRVGRRLGAEVGLDHARVGGHLGRRALGQLARRGRAPARGRTPPSPAACCARPAPPSCRRAASSRISASISCASVVVEAGGRLVEQQQLRLGGQRARDLQALERAVGHGVGGRVDPARRGRRAASAPRPARGTRPRRARSAGRRSMRRHQRRALVQVAPGHHVLQRAHVEEHLQVLERAAQAGGGPAVRGLAGEVLRRPGARGRCRARRCPSSGSAASSCRRRWGR